MKQSIEIEVPDGFKAKYNPETMQVELVRKYGNPRTWEEFCATHPVNDGESFIQSDSRIICVPEQAHRDSGIDKNLCVSETEAKAFLALMQLRQLYRAWVEDWEPVWLLGTPAKYCIRYTTKGLETILFFAVRQQFSFPTKEMAEDFLWCFKDLLETAKILL